MTRKEMIDKLKFTVEACERTIELLEQESCEDAIDIEIEALDKEPCEDAISRKAVIECFGDIHPLDYNALAQANAIKKLPSVTPARPKGRWIKIKEERGLWRCSFWRCSICEKRLEWRYNFCPDCGADMREE